MHNGRVRRRNHIYYIRFFFFFKHVCDGAGQKIWQSLSYFQFLPAFERGGVTYRIAMNCDFISSHIFAAANLVHTITIIDTIGARSKRASATSNTSHIFIVRLMAQQLLALNPSTNSAKAINMFITCRKLSSAIYSFTQRYAVIR